LYVHGWDKRPERKNVSGLCAPAGHLLLQKRKLDHVHAECCSFRPQRQKQVHTCTEKGIGARCSRHEESKLLAAFFAKNISLDLSTST
jgi:hypothetical protein